MADVPLYAALFKDELSLYQDMSGDSLHKRGYRMAMHASSLNEAAAAGVLSLAGWPAAASSGKQTFAVQPLLRCCPDTSREPLQRENAELTCVHSSLTESAAAEMLSLAGCTSCVARLSSLCCADVQV